MRAYLKYTALILLLCLPACKPDKERQEAIKWHVGLDKDDKLPYGTWLANQSLKYFFPGSEVKTLPKGFRYSNIDVNMRRYENGPKLLVLNGLDFYVSDDEWIGIKRFAGAGNEVILFCSNLDNKIEQELNCYKKAGYEDFPYFGVLRGEHNKEVLTTYLNPYIKYGYAGRPIDGYFLTGGIENHSDSVIYDTTQIRRDTIEAKAEEAHPEAQKNETVYSSGKDVSDEDNEPNRPDTLGYAFYKPDFVRYKVAEGHITLHGAPLALSNYFLLQDGNEAYLSAIWQTLPPDITTIYWNDYYKHDPEPSHSSVLWRYPATRLALLLGIFALLVYILFEGKRKQRVVPVIAPLKNDSVSFVETVGRLYYNKGNHKNLSDKMVQQFLEWVRMHYFLNTNLLDEHFINQLTIKSGQPAATVRGLTEMIAEIKKGSVKIDDAYLYQLYNTIQQFYKKQP